MKQPKQNKALKYFITSLLLLVLVAHYSGNFDSALQQSSPSFASSEIERPRHIVVSDKARQHILYGDASGGGHIYGANKPCKSEFPQDWDAQEIISTVEKLAANDNLNWRREDNGYYVTEAFEDDVKIRVVLGNQQEQVITAYPLNQKRNPCDKPPKGAANDNYNR